MKKIILLFVFMIFVSCSSDGNTYTDDNVSRLVKIKETDLTNNDVSEINYIYDNIIGYVTRIEYSATNRSDYFYLDGKLSAIKEYEGNQLVETTTYSYTGDVITSSSNSYGNTTYNYTYAYNITKQVVSKKKYSKSMVLIDTETYEYNNQGNVLKKTTKDGVTTFLYDIKSNPAVILLPRALRILDAEFGGLNNLISNSQGDSFEIEYNASNYPKTIISKNNGIASIKQEFFYQ